MLDAAASPLDDRCDILFVGGRVIDPETGLDAVRNVGVRGATIVYVGTERPPADSVRDVTGAVVSPGFIDLHSHAQSPTGLLLQAQDGVTTALELEGGALPVGLVYERAEAEGRPINFGFSASWGLARMHVLDGVRLPDADSPEPLAEPIHLFEHSLAGPRWNTLATEYEVSALLEAVEQGVREGGIGIGVLLGYSPASGRDEFFRTAALAERLGVPAFTHSRQMSNIEPGSSLDGALEIISAAAGTGAALHICHINSTSLRRIDDIATAVEVAQSRGNSITTEGYPYPRGSTGVGAAFFEPDQLHRLGITPRAIQYLPTGERIADTERLAYLRRTDPGGLCIIDFLDPDDPEQFAMLLRGLTLEGGAIASDAMPLTAAGSRIHDAWPVPDGALTHPRSAGCFARLFGWMVRDLGVFSLAEAVRRVTLIPADLLGDAVPAMRRKGRVQVGADADLTVFDPETISDLATFETVKPSTGFRHVLVGGVFVVEDGNVHPTRRPGRAIRSEVR
ncbi:amidohydrolase family protein [Microbacterium sp. RD1]|uniref:amidohydrolase family protein n=1 Tax=Microbacterium sp. RD1 TaxID=3457313 RepID=UPI003FA60DCA